MTALTGSPYTIIDIGPTQGLPDWKRIASGRLVHAAYLKATEGASGAGSEVPTFAQNAAGCVAAGLPFGAYHFLSALSPAVAQAEHFLKTIEGCGATLPPMVDVERGAGDAGRIPSVDVLLELLSLVEHQLGTPVIYTAAWVTRSNGMAAHPELARYPLWVADYRAGVAAPMACPPWDDWLIWQYTGRGYVPGVAGDVDISRAKALPGA